MSEVVLLRGGYRSSDPRLDRIPSQNWQRLEAFPASDLVAEDEPIHAKLHRRGALLDQDPESGYDGSGCVGFSTLNFLRSSPVRNPRLNTEMGWVDLQKQAAIYFYHQAQKRDEWQGEDYAGTSVDAAGKFMKELGVYGEYHWVTGGTAELARVLQTQPVQVGSWWTTDMDAADTNEFGIARYSGRKRGGHAWLCDGVLPDAKFGDQYSELWFRGYQTWGPWGWHKNGTFWIPKDDMGALIQDQGEVMVPTEILQNN